MESRKNLYLLLMGAALLLAYANSLSGEFVLDDATAIVSNPHLTRLWPLHEAMQAPRGSTNSGRPVACLSLALNYAVSGYSIAGFRAANVLLQLLSGLLLFGIVYRTLRNSSRISVELKDRATGLAGACAALWVLHPLHSVLINYVAQRCELLASLFILLCLYCAIRSFENSARAMAWRCGAVGAAVLGAGSKEVAVVAPLLVLLYERIFVRESWRALIQSSGALYAGLLMSWVVLGVLLASGGTAEGANTGRLAWGPGAYLLTQAQSILLYLQLAVWPHPLCFDYGQLPAQSFADAGLSFLGVAALFGATVWALAARPALGYLGVWFFLLLAPSSSVMPLPDLTVEYRASLALAAFFVLLVLAAWRVTVKINAAAASRWVLGATCLALLVATHIRNYAYRTELDLWTDTVHKRPLNARAHTALGIALAKRGDRVTAERALRHALKLNPAREDVHMSLGAFLAMQGRSQEALPHLLQVQSIAPHSAHHAFNLGNLYSDLKQPERAIEAYRRAIELNPGMLEAHLNLGVEYFGRKDYAEALLAFDRALALNSSSASAHLMRGRTLRALNRRDEAIAAFRHVLSLEPGNRNALGELKSLQ